jgi:hypothetical protein
MPQTTEAPVRSTAKVAMPEGRLATSDPESRASSISGRQAAPRPRADCQRNTLSPAVLEGWGRRSSKYAEGRPESATTAAAIRRHGGAAGDRSGEAVVRRGSRQCQAHSGAQATRLSTSRSSSWRCGAWAGSIRVVTSPRLAALLRPSLRDSYGVGDDGRSICAHATDRA